MSNDARATSPFGDQLRHWRQRAGMSQLALANGAETTARHLSFIETGRSRPGRELVLRLAAALDLPLAERNALLVSAGLAPQFTARALSDAAMRPITLVLDKVLAAHEPYPAWVYARGLQAIRANAAADALFPGLCMMSPESIIELWFAPGPFRELVENWADVVRAGVDSLRREARRSSDAKLLALLRLAETRARDLPPASDSIDAELAVACPRFRIDGRTVRTISTVMRFDTALDVTAADLRVELMFPADDESEAFFRSRATSATTPGSATLSPAR